MSSSDIDGDHLFELRILAEEMLAHVGAVARLVVLVFAVDGFHHAPLQQAIVYRWASSGSQ